jgi:hypothetical protein
MRPSQARHKPRPQLSVRRVRELASACADLCEYVLKHTVNEIGDALPRMRASSLQVSRNDHEISSQRRDLAKKRLLVDTSLELARRAVVQLHEVMPQKKMTDSFKTRIAKLSL